MQADFSTELKRVIHKAVQGNINPSIEFLHQIDDKNLSSSDLKQKNELIDRFENKIFPVHSNEDVFVQKILKEYYTYWTKVLKQEKPILDANNELFSILKQITENAGKNTDIKGINDLDKLENLIKETCELKSYYLLMGITHPLRELMIWKKQTEEKFEIDLEDTIAEVPVAFLEDFICRGWLGFATLNRMSTGGWATKEKIYRVGKKPEHITNEKFFIDILVHEGRHFSDYVLFPKLQQKELEYRAKLTELTKAKETLKERTINFVHSAKEDSTIPHAFSAYHVIKQLSKMIFQTEFQKDEQAWKNTPPDVIQTTARTILQKNTDWLKQHYPQDVETFLL